MWYIIIFILGLIGLIVGFTSATSCANPNKNTTDVPPDSIKGQYNREEVEKLLEQLSSAKIKEDLNLGAMCYAPRAITEKAEYICPVCGEKTVYTNYQAEFILYEIPGCRQMVQRFGGKTLLLDESQFCRHCTRDSVANPQLCLITKLEGADPVRTCGIYRIDLVILTDFFEGHTLYKTFNDSEIALKERIPRIRELLGIKE